MDKSQQHMLGLDPEPQVKVGARVWFGQKLALWRSKVGWDIAVKQAAEIVLRCRHAGGCPGAKDEHAPCVAECPDREIRMSALVVLNAARQFAPPIASKLANQPYVAPTREYFSEVVADLAACQAELAALRGTVVTAPPENDPPKLEEKPQ
jgi:hypothetical protein